MYFKSVYKTLSEQFDYSTLKSTEVIWIALFVSAYFLLYLTPSNFFYINLVILQLFLVFFIYKYNLTKRTGSNLPFNSFSVLGIIVLQIIYLINNINVLQDQMMLMFIIKTLLTLTIILLSNQSDEWAIISNTILFVLFIWFIFDQNSVSFQFQS